MGIIWRYSIISSVGKVSRRTTTTESHVLAFIRAKTYVSYPLPGGSSTPFPIRGCGSPTGSHEAVELFGLYCLGLHICIFFTPNSLSEWFSEGLLVFSGGNSLGWWWGIRRLYPFDVTKNWSFCNIVMLGGTRVWWGCNPRIYYYP
jgi:hypothetical protein